MADLRIATRRSNLALSQTGWVADRLVEAHPGLVIEVVEVVTTGDRDVTSSVTSLTEMGAFVRGVQQAVLDGVADVAVHSCKDLPVDGPEGLTAFYPKREVPWDVLCGSDLERLPGGARVGTGSPRRSAQLALLRPDLAIRGIRGNVETRLAKVASGEFAAVVLAEAGLRRLGLGESVAYRFPVSEMVPAPAQAALAVETGAGSWAADLLEALDDSATRLAVEAERAVLARTGAGCRSALGVFGTHREGVIELHGFVSDEAGARRGAVSDGTPDLAAKNLIEVMSL